MLDKKRKGNISYSEIIFEVIVSNCQTKIKIIHEINSHNNNHTIFFNYFHVSL